MVDVRNRRHSDLQKKTKERWCTIFLISGSVLFLFGIGTMEAEHHFFWGLITSALGLILMFLALVLDEKIPSRYGRN